MCLYAEKRTEPRDCGTRLESEAAVTEPISAKVEQRVLIGRVYQPIECHVRNHMGKLGHAPGVPFSVQYARFFVSVTLRILIYLN